MLQRSGKLRLKGWLESIGKLFQQSCKTPSIGRLKIPSKNLPSANIRPFSERDFQECCEIYRLNEPGRFPDGYYQHFKDFIGERRSLFLVVIVSDHVIGFGGVRLFPPPDDNQANLNFGMIHPEYQKMGYGSVLLLARLAILPEPSPHVFASLSPVKLSESFYTRFGFRFNRMYRDSFDNRSTDLFCIALTAKDWKTCKSVLNDAGVAINIDPAEIPRIAFEEPTGV
jgi:GNAT superfamily N-acetyltransferase